VWLEEDMTLVENNLREGLWIEVKAVTWGIVQLIATKRANNAV